MFTKFAQPVAKAFQEIVKEPNAFIVDVDGDALYQLYLASFPEGTNPFFRKTTEHDCSCCRQFIKRAGGVVAIDGDSLATVWDRAVEKAPEPYARVAACLRDAVRAAKIRDIFRVSESSFGAERSFADDKETGKVRTWNHFFTGPIPKNYQAVSPDAERGEYRTTVQVFERGLIELTPDAVESVLGLVNANNLYRGEEHKPALVAFQKAQREYLAAGAGPARAYFVWANAASPAARFRNTVIGTLVQDLSEGKDLEHAVRGFESKVAPTNYKRTTALITPGMVKKAMETIETLGLESALERRFATIADVSVRDVKWVDGAARPLMKGGLADVLMKHATASSGGVAKDIEERAEEISLNDFMTRILPETTGLEILFRNELVGNLVSITAPVNTEPKQLFRWTNDFAWSYGGNVADSIRERVKKAGGKVDGAILRVSLSWFNYDDLDLHVFEPPGRGVHAAAGRIFFGSRRGWTGGVLDVDMNAGNGTTRAAVENVVWSVKPPDGAYRVVVNNYAQRETSDPGFVVEVESGGKLTHFTYNKQVKDRTDIVVASLYVKDGVVERLEVGDPGIVTGAVTQDKWGLKTEQYAKVSAVMLSPNYWGENAVGNKHTFFVIDGAKNDEAARGFYNEFLHPRLEPHRKVFEIIGDKTKCAPTAEQLSGLGFSSTKKESFVVRAQQGKRRRVFNVHVGA